MSSASPAVLPKVRKRLSADVLYGQVRTAFTKFPDHRHPKASLALPDALMPAFALFSLKDPSLLAFEERRHDGNMRTLFRIGQIPTDTRMREILDGLDPQQRPSPHAGRPGARKIEDETFNTLKK